MGWQHDGKHRAFPGLRIHNQISAGLFNHPVGRRQPKSGARPDLLGRKERLEDVLEILLGNTNTGIGHPDHHLVTRRDRLDAPALISHQRLVDGRDRQLTTPNYGIDLRVAQSGDTGTPLL